MGSEMCIRDRGEVLQGKGLKRVAGGIRRKPSSVHRIGDLADNEGCLLYTSDAADERSSVDLGGRRIIKKKTRRDSGGRRRTKIQAAEARR